MLDFHLKNINISNTMYNPFKLNCLQHFCCCCTLPKTPTIILALVKKSEFFQRCAETGCSVELSHSIQHFQYLRKLTEGKHHQQSLTLKKNKTISIISDLVSTLTTRCCPLRHVLIPSHSTLTWPFVLHYTPLLVSNS